MLSFTGSRLDRADHVRADPERLAGYMNWKARVLALDGLIRIGIGAKGDRLRAIFGLRELLSQ